MPDLGLFEWVLSWNDIGINYQLTRIQLIFKYYRSKDSKVVGSRTPALEMITFQSLIGHKREN